MTETPLNPLTGWENDMKSIKVMETDLNGAIEAVRTGKAVYADSACTTSVDELSFSCLVHAPNRSFYYKLECEKREYVEIVEECNRDKRLTVFVPDVIPDGTECYVTVEIPINASPTAKV